MQLIISRYLKELRENAIRFERIDINGLEDISFLGKYLKKIICSIISILIVYNLKDGFSQSFVSYASTILSILIGLFITAMIFSFDKFYKNPNFGIIYDLSIAREETHREDKKFKVSINEINEPNSKQKLWNTQSYNYSKQFAYITGYNIVLCIFAIILLSLSALFENAMNINVFKFDFVFHDLGFYAIKNFIIALFVLIQRFFVLYWILSVMYNTLFIVSSMVNFMTVKINRNND